MTLVTKSPQPLSNKSPKISFWQKRWGLLIKILLIPVIYFLAFWVAILILMVLYKETVHDVAPNLFYFLTFIIGTLGVVSLLTLRREVIVYLLTVVGIILIKPLLGLAFYVFFIQPCKFTILSYFVALFVAPFGPLIVLFFLFKLKDKIIKTKLPKVIDYLLQYGLGFLSFALIFGLIFVLGYALTIVTGGSGCEPW